MRLALFIMSLLSGLHAYAQKIDIITPDKSNIRVKLLDPLSVSRLTNELNGRQDNTLRKPYTARTFVLADRKILVEFYDRQAILIDNLSDFKKLDQVRFVKNTIDFLKKNISYKIELSENEGRRIIAKESPERLQHLKSGIPGYSDYEVYELHTGQVLYIERSKNASQAVIYADLKTLASEQSDIAEQVYAAEDEEHLMKRLASGDTLPDYEPDVQLLYPKYLEEVIKNHKLHLVRSNVYVFSPLFGNLYQSDRGYYMVIDEINQKNGAGDKMPILCLYLYETLQQVSNAEARFQAVKNGTSKAEHFYHKISERYGAHFADAVPQLIDTLPALLNFDKEQLSFDSTGMDLVDKALKWISDDEQFFDTCFPSILAYYGQCYMANKQDGKWITFYDKHDHVWIPELILKDGSAAWDWGSFYKSLYEAPGLEYLSLITR